jgi:hypothetical protein
MTTTNGTEATATAAPRARKTTSSASGPAKPVRSGEATKGLGAKVDLSSAMEVLAEGDVMTPEGLYQFLESLRILSTGAAFYVESAGTQLERAVKRGARANADGRLTMQQKMELRLVLRRVARALSAAHNDLFAVAKDAMNAYTPMEDFLERLADERTPRPHRSTKGGFDLFGGN